jgi:hypothetical protein
MSSKPVNPANISPPPLNATDPFKGRPFNPFPSGSPLAGNAAAQQRARGVNVQSAQEQNRAANLTTQVGSGNAPAPTFRPVSSPAPFPNDAARQPGVPNVAQPAGGSRSNGKS